MDAYKIGSTESALNKPQNEAGGREREETTSQTVGPLSKAGRNTVNSGASRADVSHFLKSRREESVGEGITLP